jgi:hypothetical protein
MKDFKFYWSSFGKRKGLEVYHSSANLSKDKKVSDLLYQQMHLNAVFHEALNGSDILYKTFRVEDNNNNYIFILAYQFNFDHFKRGGFNGGAAIFKNSYPLSIIALKGLINELLFISNQETQGISTVTDAINNLAGQVEYEEHDYDFSILESNEVLINQFDDDVDFISKSFLDNIGNFKKTYFTSQQSVFNDLKKVDLKIEKIDQLRDEQLVSWEDKIFSIRRDIDLDRSVFNEKIAEFEKNKIEINEEIKKLAEDKLKLEHDLIKLTKNISTAKSEKKDIIISLSKILEELKK